MTRPTPAIGDWLADLAARPVQSTLTIEQETTTTADLDRAASRVASALLAAGLRPGDRVAVLGQASVGFLQLWFGIARAGLIEVPLNPAAGPYLLRYYLQQSGACAIFCDAAYAPAVREAAAELPEVRRIIVIDGSGEDSLAAYATHRLDPLPEVDPTGTAVLLYTSGTTGAPKGALLSHRANVNLARYNVRLMDYTSADTLYAVFPLYHSNARFCSVMSAMEAGADLLLHRRFTASGFWDITRAHDITAFNYQGAMMSILFKQPERADDRDNPVRVGFGAPCPVEIFEPFEERFGVALTEIYGSTETSLVCDMPPARRRIGTCGTETELYQLRIVDAEDNEVPAGTPGEIVARPKNPGWMFDGYHANAAATAEAWRNLWFHTGDRGQVDPDGYLTFLDRMKDTIRRRGENISSWEIERIVAEHPAVGQVGAYGVRSELSEEDVMIAVVAAPGAEVRPEEIIAHCTQGLTRFAIPRYIRMMDALPLTPSQRIEKYKLRADGVTADTWDREAADV
ncbi:AMP-binding protein [Granulicoccus phenolivorans]|uniref:AMP-binding protein n=1 Tax=Granulicoccus phenolivorans TaxID=266854 RepID=UPI00138B0F5C|nr:AMP-binding protein [Granulicoccus phenolivorans]